MGDEARDGERTRGPGDDGRKREDGVAKERSGVLENDGEL